MKFLTAQIYQLEIQFFLLLCGSHLENPTRRSPALLVLLSVINAYNKGAFKAVGCPVNIDESEIYAQILLPTYSTSLLFQNDYSTIDMIIPNIWKLIHFYQICEFGFEEHDYRDFCTTLIHYLKRKFKYELESQIYRVSLDCIDQLIID